MGARRQHAEREAERQADARLQRHRSHHQAHQPAAARAERGPDRQFAGAAGDRERHDAIEPGRRQQQPGTAERGEEGAEHAVEHRLPVDHGPHGLRVPHRQPAAERGHQRPERPHRHGGAGPRAQGDGERLPHLGLRDRHVEARPALEVAPEPLHQQVGHDADDRQPRMVRRGGSRPEPLADRIRRRAGTGAGSSRSRRPRPACRGDRRP